MAAYTVDTLFKDRIQICQPRDGYRFSIDPLLLASHISPLPGSRIIDMGCGCGIIPLILGFRHKTVKITGIEIQEELANLAQKNMSENALSQRIRILHRDIRELEPGDVGTPADIILSNPPYKRKNSGRLNPTPQKAVARHEICIDLPCLLEKAFCLLSPGGTLCLIYPVSRLGELMPEMSRAGFRPNWLRFVHPRPHSPATRVLVCGTNRGNPETQVLDTLYLYDRDGNPTKEHSGLFNA